MKKGTRKLKRCLVCGRKNGYKRIKYCGYRHYLAAQRVIRSYRNV